MQPTAQHPQRAECQKVQKWSKREWHLTHWVAEAGDTEVLQRERTQVRQARTQWIPHFGRRCILGMAQAGLQRALRCAQRRRENAIDEEAIAAERTIQDKDHENAARAKDGLGSVETTEEPLDSDFESSEAIKRDRSQRPTPSARTAGR